MGGQLSTMTAGPRQYSFQIDHGRVLAMRQDLIGIVAGWLCLRCQICEVFLDRSDIQPQGCLLRKLGILVLCDLLIFGPWQRCDREPPRRCRYATLMLSSTSHLVLRGSVLGSVM
jgi:hypothetical protein